MQINQDAWHNLLSTLKTHFWFKSFGTMGFMLIFFSAYLYLLKHPAYAVTVMPVTLIDREVRFEPLALPVYLSLWLFVSLPPMMMQSRMEIARYGAWIGSLCLAGLAIFYFWPSAVPPTKIDWAQYPGVVFLKNIDAAGNACPSLHVATAAFSAFWLHWKLPMLGLGLSARLLNAGWCLAIVYSTMAVKQHVFVDVVGGMALAGIFIWSFQSMGAGKIRAGSDG